MAFPRRREPRRLLSNLLILTGVVLALSPLVWVWVGMQRAGDIQAAALAEWERAGSSRAVPGRRPSSADPGMVLTIPRLSLRRFVAEGASRQQLNHFGVGRISWTPLPEQVGIVGIAGHRTTYGAPFFRLNRLAEGDTIQLDHRGRRYTYRVVELRTVRPAQVDVLQAPTIRRGVALVTCTPPYSAAYRLVVLGTLENVGVLGASR